MRRLSPAELLLELIEEVELVAASRPDQEAWAHRAGFPSEELALQLYDTVPSWVPLLLDANLIGSEDATTVMDLVSLVQQTQLKLFHNLGVTDVPEWEPVRSLARVALARLQDPRPANAPR